MAGDDARAVHPLIGAVSLAMLLGSGSYGAWFWLTRDVGPSADAFPIAARVVRDNYAKGDLIFLVPFYATRGREWLGDLLPLAVRDPLDEDFAVHPRAWVFGLFGEGEKVRAQMIAAGMKLVRSETPAPGITVDLLETGGSMKVSYSFLENLKKAKVHHEKDGTKTPCAQWNERNGQGGLYGRWACPYDSDWFYVAPEWHRLGDHLRLCLWAHPPNQGRLVISFPAVPLTGQLSGRAGHTLNSSRWARAPVNLDVAVGDLPEQRFIFQLSDFRRPYMLDTPTTGTATVTFAVSSPDAGTNHFCFTADMLEVK